MIKKTYIPGKPRNPKLSTTTGASGVGKTEFNQVAGSSHEHYNKGVLDQLTDDHLLGALREVITEVSDIEPSDENLMSALRIVREIADAKQATLDEVKDKYLSKVDSDTAQGVIRFLQGIKADGSSEFDELIAKEQANLKKGFKTGDYGVNESGEAQLKKVTSDEEANLKKGFKTGSHGVDVDGLATLKHITLEDGFKSPEFIQGLAGEGVRLSKKEGTRNQYVLELYELIVNGKLTVNTIEVLEWKHVGAGQIFSHAGFVIDRVEELSDRFRVYPEKPEMNTFQVNSQALCQQFGEGTTGKRYWRLVIAVATDRSYIDLSKSIAEEGSDIPEAGDSIFAYGYRGLNNALKGAIVISSYGDSGPYIQTLRGIDSFDVSGKTQIFIGNETYFRVNHFEVQSGSGDFYRVPVDKGKWSTGTTAYYYDRYSHDGSLWLCVAQPSTTEEPSDSSVAWEKQVEKGQDGAKGVSIILVDAEFAVNSSKTNPPTSGWTSTAPTLAEGDELWTRTRTEYSDGAPTYTNPVNITPLKGNVGQGIESVTEEYAISTSKTVQPTSGWSTTQPTWSQGQYIWSRVKVVYKNPTSTVYTGYAVSSEWEAVNNLEIGGRNIILDTNSFKNTVIYGNRGPIIGRNYNEFTFETGTNNTGPILLFSETLTEDNYVLSFTVVASEDAELNYISLRTNATQTAIGTNTYRLPTQNLNEGRNRVEIKFKGILSVNALWLATNLTGVVRFTISDLKLEKGNKATDWTPAPEDVEASIETAKTEAENAAKAYADTKAEAERVLAEAYADGKVSAEEQARIDDVNAKLAAAKAYADAQDALLKTQQEAYADGVANEAELAAIAAAEAYADLKKTEAQAYADGKVSAEEARAIADATAKFNEAKTHAETLVNNLEIGGRNLVKTVRSVSFLPTYNVTATKSIIDDATVPSGFFLRLDNYTKTGSSDGFYFPGDSSHYTESLKGKRVTISFYMRGDIPFLLLGLGSIEIGTEWTKVVTTRVWPSTGNLHIFSTNADKIGLKTMDLSSIKIEKGNKATDWTPAPEDVQAEIDDAKQEVERVETETNARFISNEEQIGLQATSIANVVNELTGVKTRLADSEAAIVVNANAINQRVTTTTYDANNAAIQNQFSAINQRADGIESSVSTVNSKVDNLKIGGRNLFSNSTTVISRTGIGTYSKRDDINGFYAVGQNNNYDNYVRLNNVIKGNGHYTVSFEMRGTQSSVVGLYVSIAGVKSASRFVTNNLNTYNGRKYYTVEVTNYSEENSHVDFHLQWAYFYIKDIKVEKGNKATDWTPAPEDVQSDYESKIKQAADSISLAVYNKTLDELNPATELKLTSSSIKLTVAGDIAAAKSEAISAASSDATTKANNAKDQAISAAATDATNKVNGLKADLSGTGIDIEAGILTLYSGAKGGNAGGKIIIAGDNFSVDANGKLKAVDGEFSGKITAISGRVGGFTINGNNLINAATDARITFDGLDGGQSFIRFNTSSSMISVRTDVSNKTGLNISTFASGAVGLSILSNAGSALAIESVGGHFFYQRSSEIWSSPGILAAVELQHPGAIVTQSWAVHGVNASSINFSESGSVVTWNHNLGHTNYVLIPTSQARNGYVVVGARLSNSVSFTVTNHAANEKLHLLLIGRNKYVSI